jgi:hypothetical protein
VQPTNSNGPGAASPSESKVNAAEMSPRAADPIDAKRGAAAGGLDSAAAALDGKADSLPGGEQVANAAHVAADAMGTAADYVRDNNLKNMLADVRRIVKNNPGPALLTAAALGFLIARTFSRD